MRNLANGYDGPYLIVNTALNLVHVPRLDWQERKAESFVLTPRFCGSEDTGYRRTTAGYGGNVTLGSAVTISGAAASPNMGYHSSPSVTVLLTIFNARLGAWMGNPAVAASWNTPGPSMGALYLFGELFGLTGADTPYVYLSDGGHFENLGTYELVRRRCRYVILCDAGQDGNHTFEDLGNLIRKCRTDFGIRIEIDLDSLRLAQGEVLPLALRHRQDPLRRRGPPGGAGHPGLPQAIADGQRAGGRTPLCPALSGLSAPVHGEPVFQRVAVRELSSAGQHVAEAVFAQSVDDMEEEASGPEAVAETPGQYYRWRCRAMFASVVRRWFAMPPEYEAEFLNSTAGFIEMQKALRQEPKLWRLTLDLYPELEPTAEADLLAASEEPEERSRRAAELHAILQMLQVMENAWLSLNLDVHYAHPLNRGWMDIFHRWASPHRARTLAGGAAPRSVAAS